jgi:hypothetical protein
VHPYVADAVCPTPEDGCLPTPAVPLLLSGGLQAKKINNLLLSISKLKPPFKHFTLLS